MIIALLFLGTVVNYIDRLAIPVMPPVIQADLQLTNVQSATINPSLRDTFRGLPRRTASETSCAWLQ